MRFRLYITKSYKRVITMSKPKVHNQISMNIITSLTSSVLRETKAEKTFPKSAGCTLGEQKRPNVLLKELGANAKCIAPNNYAAGA